MLTQTLSLTSPGGLTSQEGLSQQDSDQKSQHLTTVLRQQLPFVTRDDWHPHSLSQS